MTLETPLVLVTATRPTRGKVTKRFDMLAITWGSFGYLRLLDFGTKQLTVQVAADAVERLERLLGPIDAP